MRPSLQKIKDDNDGKFPAYAWPGGYPIIYIANDGETVCADCMNDPSNADWAFDKDSHDRVVGWDIYYEGPPEHCVNCNAEIESAYGDPDDPDRDKGDQD